MNNTNRYSKVYGRRKSRKRYFNPAATTVLSAHIIPAESNSSTTTTTSTTNLSQLERLPFSNINNNQRRLSEESGIYGGKIAKLARPVKHVFDLDSDSDEDLCGDSFPTTHTPTNGTATSTISAECSVGTNTVEKLSSPIQYNKPFDEFAVRTVFKPVATSTTKSDAVSPMAKKTLCLSSTPNETHEHLLQQYQLPPLLHLLHLFLSQKISQKKLLLLLNCNILHFPVLLSLKDDVVVLQNVRHLVQFQKMSV